MAISKYDEITLPLLRIMSDGKENSRQELPTLIAEHFRPSEEERNRKLPSRQSTYLKWENTVGEPELRDFVGALHIKRASKGVFLTTSEFSAPARRYVEMVNFKISLIDGRIQDFRRSHPSARQPHRQARHPRSTRAARGQR